jgi:hypothetical protein
MSEKHARRRYAAIVSFKRSLRLGRRYFALAVQLGIWKYPLGGAPVKSFPGLTRPLGLTVSVGR